VSILFSAPACEPFYSCILTVSNARSIRSHANIVTVVGVTDDQEDQILLEHPELHRSEVVCHQLGVAHLAGAIFAFSFVTDTLFIDDFACGRNIEEVRMLGLVP
jgi:hypothetical protein